LLHPQENGTTLAEPLPPSDTITGTRIVVQFGPNVPADDDPLAWARTTLELAASPHLYKGKPSPFWFDTDSFHELCLAAGTRSVRALIAELDGCTGGRAGEITGRVHPPPGPRHY
jgi:hypothetical protein